LVLTTPETNATGPVPDDETVAVAAIMATLPKCPQCGSDIDKVQFVAHQTQRFIVQLGDDGKGGIDVLAYSREHDTLDVEPNTVDGHVVVECENQHEWREPRLKLKWQDVSGGADWTILP
jgi:hypothetical protein